MDDLQLERAVLDHVNQPNYRPVKPRVIAQQMDVPEGQHSEVKKAIKRLMKKGKLTYGSNHLVQPAGHSNGHSDGSGQQRNTGIFRRTQSGSGFVRLTGPGATGKREDDIYIPANKARDAASGDTVLVRLLKRGDGPRRRGESQRRVSGEIVEVLQRETHQFVGTYFEAADAGFVQVDGGVFSQAVLVDDPGAKNAQPDDKVVIEMVRFPSHMHDGEGVIVDVLGKRGEPGVDTLSIIREFNLPDEFPDSVLEAARRESDKFDESLSGPAAGGKRLDLTKLTVITIDPADARDFDDAISLERIEPDHWRLGVHIADVSHFVRAKGQLDQEAHDRATSVYLPDRVIPMLPEIISNNLASLQPKRVRYTKTVFIEFTAGGAHVSTEAHSAAIKSKHRFTYKDVDDWLANPGRWKKKLTREVFDLLGRMHELAMILRKRRFDRGAMELTLPEIKLNLDRQGRVSGARLVENTESHQIIEEFMLAANEAVARLIYDHGASFLRRIHESPDPRKLKALTEFVHELGIESESLQSRFEIQRVLGKVAGKPEEHAVNYAVLRSMQKAIYGPQEEGHFALASDYYCHFTSPIRRYPDLTIHRLLSSIIKSRKPTSHFDELLVLGQHCSEREQRAAGAERELIKVKLLDYMSQRIGQKMDAVVTGVHDFGLFVQGVELPAEGLIHIRTLQDDYYHYDATTHSLTGSRQRNRYRLGDLLRVEVAHVDVDRRELDFRLVGLLKHPASVKRKPAKKKAKSARKKPAKRARKRRR